MSNIVGYVNRPFMTVSTRWYNEERFAMRFLRNWWMADEIVVMDGGSTDRSKEILLSDPRVKWYEFLETVPGRLGGRRQPEGRHINACLEKAKGEWIFHQESDIWPSIALQNVLERTMDDKNCTSIMTYLYYLAPGSIHHYPRMITGVGITGWRRCMDVKCDPNSIFEPGWVLPRDMRKKTRANSIELPIEQGRVHMSWENEEEVAKKINFYNMVHGLRQLHPDKTWGPRGLIPPYLKWYDYQGRVVGGGEPVS